MDLPRHLLWTAAWTTLWCVLHSMLLTRKVRDGVRRLFPRWHVFDRLAYVVFSTLSLVVLAAWWGTLPAVTLWDWPGWWSWVRWLGLAEAALLFWLGVRVHDGHAFLGLRQARDHLAGRQSPAPRLLATGILGVIRHPWYTGTLVALVFCLPVTDVNLVWRLVFVLYILVGTELEERKLLREFGPIYAEYRRRVPRFVPLNFRR